MQAEPITNRPDSVTSVSSVVRKPLIGLTCRYVEGRGAYDLPVEYADAVTAAGGAPVMIPLIPEQASELAGRLDGIILSGSPSDVDPARYGATRHASITSIAEQLDATCFALLDFAERKGLPVLGICYGMQAINVHRGGTLIQHIPDVQAGAVPDAAVNHQDREGRHDVSLADGTRFAAWADSPTQSVNSTHHQAVDQIGRELRVTARSADGIIEAVECTLPNRSLIAVQWHPERIWRESAISARLFAELVRAAAEYRLTRTRSEPRQ